MEARGRGVGLPALASSVEILLLRYPGKKMQTQSTQQCDVYRVFVWRCFSWASGLVIPGTWFVYDFNLCLLCPAVNTVSRPLEILKLGRPALSVDERLTVRMGVCMFSPNSHDCSPKSVVIFTFW